jgi:hypothetical protein
MSGYLGRRALLGAIALAAVLSPAFAHAGKPCVTYSVSAPGASPGGTICSPVGDSFTSTYTERHCGGVPPAGTQFCLTATVYVP